MAMETDKAEAQATNNQSQTRSVNELSKNDQNKQWSLQITLSVHIVRQTTAENIQTVEKRTLKSSKVLKKTTHRKTPYD